MLRKIISAFVPGFGYKNFDAGVKRYLSNLCLACCTKLFCPLFRVTDIRFSKCSEQGARHRTQPDYIRHRGSSNPCLDIVSKHC